MDKVFFQFKKLRIKYEYNNDEVEEDIIDFRIELFSDINEFKLELNEKNCYDFNNFDKQLDYYNSIVSCCKNGIKELRKRKFINKHELIKYKIFENHYKLQPIIISEDENYYEEIKNKNKNDGFSPIGFVSKGICNFKIIEKDEKISNYIEYNGKRYKYIISLFEISDLI